MRHVLLAALVAATPAMAMDRDLIDGRGTVVAVDYVCDGGVRVPVVFSTATNGESFATAVIDGGLYGMRQVVSASGARYKAPGRTPLVLWSKGDTAFVMRGDDGPIVIDNCVAR